MPTLTLAKISDKKWKEIAPRLPRAFAPEAISKRFEELGDGVVFKAGAGWVALVDAEDGTGTFYVMREGDKTPQKTDVPPAKALRLHGVSSDGGRACVAASEDVHEVDLDTLKSRVVFRVPDESWVGSMAYLAGDRAAIVEGSTLHFVETGAKWREVASMKLEGENELTAIRGGTILLVTPSGWYGARRPVAYAVEAEALKEIGRADAHFKKGADELEGRVFVTDSSWKHHELLGLPEATSKAK